MFWTLYVSEHFVRNKQKTLPSEHILFTRVKRGNESREE